VYGCPPGVTLSLTFSTEQLVLRALMSRKSKLKAKLLSGGADKNFDWNELCTLIQQLGFTPKGGKGGHRTFAKDDVVEIIDLQPTKDGKAKPYQVRQVRDIVLRYKL
jgi:predicted RNA binding protein YcfA (HicA-like mRNA interferase family)